MGTSTPILHFLFAAGLLFAQGATLAQEYPSRPIHLIVANSPGATTDRVARILAIELAKAIGQTVIVDNKPGANSQIGYEYVAKYAPADGYTLLIATRSGLASLPLLANDLRFNPLKDLPTVTDVAESRIVLVTSSKYPWKTVNAFVENARANPGKLTYATADPGMRIIWECLLQRLGLRMLNVPYSSIDRITVDLLAGDKDVHASLYAMGSAFSMGDKAQVLATSGKTRAHEFPGAPTFAELGSPQLPGLIYSLHVRAGTPKAIFDHIQAATSKALQQPQVVVAYANSHLEVVNDSPEAAAAQLVDLGKVFADVVEEGGIKLK